MAPKTCSVCKDRQDNVHKLSDQVLGKQLSAVIARICPAENAVEVIGNGKLLICSPCAAEIIYADQLVAKVRDKFVNISAKKPSEKAIDLSTLSTNTAPIPKTAYNIDEEEKFIFSCQKCVFQSPKLKAFKQHMLKIHAESALKPYACKFCSRAFSRYDFYQKHQVTDHGATKIIIKKEIPDVDENEPEEEEQEDANNDKVDNDDEADNDVEGIFKCLECSYVHEKAKVFKNHMMKAHNADEKNVFRCLHCKKSYARAYGYKYHMEQMHKADGSTRSPQIGCTHCDRKFYNKIGLMMHMKFVNAAVAAANTTNAAINEETMLTGAAATSTPVNVDAKAVNKKKHLKNLANGDANRTLPSKKTKLLPTDYEDDDDFEQSKPEISFLGNTTLEKKKKKLNKSVKQDAQSLNGSSIKRKEESLPNGSAPEKKKKKTLNKSVKQDEQSLNGNSIKRKEEGESLLNLTAPEKKKKKLHKSLVQDGEEEPALNNNSIAATDVLTYSCMYCGKTFISSKKLEKHLNKKHNL